MLLGELECQGQLGNQGRAVRPQLVECAGTDQGLQNAPVGLVQVDPPTEIPEIAEWTLGRACRDDRLDCTLADPLDGAHAVNDGARIGDGEAVGGAIDRRWLDPQTQRATLLDQGHHLVGVVHVRTEHRRHEGRRVVCLQPEGLIADQGVGGRMGLVKAVTGKLIH